MAVKKPMELVPPSENQLEKIFLDINLTREQHKKDVQTMKIWLKSQPHLPHDLDDQLLGSFIVGCKNSLERAKQTLDSYLSNRTFCPDFYQNRDPRDPTFQKVSKIVRYTMLPEMTPEGYRVSIFSLSDPNVTAADFNLRLNAVKVLCSYDVRFLEDQFWAGDIVLLDGKGYSLKLLPAVAILPLLKKYVHCVSDSLPVRYKKIIFFNLNPVVESIITLAKPFIKDKLISRIYTSTEDFTYLYKHVPQHILPNEYGGKAGKIADINDAWQLKVESYRDWFLRDMSRKVNENLRPTKSKFKPEGFYGIEGSFKKLTID